MAQFTDIFSFIKQETAENQLIWGASLEASFIELVDEGIAGLSDIDVTAGDVTLTDDDGVSNQSRPMILRFTGAPVLPLTVFVPNKQKLYAIDNQSGKTVTVKTTVATGIDVEDGETVSAVVDATTGFVFKMMQNPNGVVLTGPANLQAISSKVPSSDPADFAVTVYFFDEGDNSFVIGFEEFTFLQSAQGFLFVQPVSGSYPAPTRLQETYLYTREGGTTFECIMSSSSSGLIVSHGDSSGITFSVSITVANTLPSLRSNAPEP